MPLTNTREALYRPSFPTAKKNTETKHNTPSSYPDPFEPIDLIVEQHLSIGQVDVAVVGVVEQVSEQGEVVSCVLGPLFGSALERMASSKNTRG